MKMATFGKFDTTIVPSEIGEKFKINTHVMFTILCIFGMVFLYANESCEKAVLHQTLKMTKKGCDKSCVTPFFVFTYFVPNKRSPASPSPGTI